MVQNCLTKRSLRDKLTELKHMKLTMKSTPENKAEVDALDMEYLYF